MVENAGDERRVVGRRDVLGACSALAAGAVAGCSGLGSERTPTDVAEDSEGELRAATTSETATTTSRSSTATATATATDPPSGPEARTWGFESGLGPFADRSQADSAPSFTDRHVFAGERALWLPSDPGTSSRCSVATAPLSDTQGHSVWLNRVASEGPENATGVRLRDASPDSEAQVRLMLSDYYGGVTVRERDENGDPTGDRVRVADTPAEARYRKTDLYILSDEEVTGRFGDVARSISTALDWTAREVRFELFANGWGSGHAVRTAFDAAEVEHRRPGGRAAVADPFFSSGSTE